MKKRIFIITFLGILLDQVSKILISKYLVLYSKNSVINNFFYITYVKNDGAAWSILKGNINILIIISIGAFGFVLYNILTEEKINKLGTIIYGFLLSGLFGNLIDRVRLGYVIDFLDFNFFGYNFPVFNIADSFIVVSVIIMLIQIIRGDKHENNK